MHRRLFITGLTAVVLTAAPALAQTTSVVDQVIAQLKSQGYTKITMGRTFLGRTRIVAQNDEMRREIIINPATGEVLRDYWEVEDDDHDNDDDDDDRDDRGGRDEDDDDD
ncbi:hypothetical protein [uncultured Celeribacter sp.]|uniref:hypothetical protein n=1 Tax=uncultured Celeribacter sp. TaxID=1303376 RepID=UPI002AA6E8E1|nr:hypothetical protein [uncultured Celeribacter sp.]